MSITKNSCQLNRMINLACNTMVAVVFALVLSIGARADSEEKMPGKKKLTPFLP